MNQINVKKKYIGISSVINERLVLYMILFGILILILSIILFLYNQILFNTSEPIDADKFGRFGEFIGGFIGPIWALASIILLYLTLTLQRKELGHQREQIRINREQFVEESKRFNQARIESTLFNLLSILHNLIREMEIKIPNTGDIEYKYGRECFLYLYKIFKTEYYDELSDVEDIKNRISISFENFFNKYQEVLGNYFRTLYNIFKFLDKSLLTEEIKEVYSKIVRAQLSNYELILLFYNGLYKYGDNFKFYIIKFKLFDNILINKLINPTVDITLYPDEAFGTSKKSEI